ncbi:antibiotic biosynthesis monooxygenase family protein [Streptomyces sp. NPDC000351]|uniref:antibiotic biosynthesis monooxygenase family protein n=1 Tax=Streptomyces sp. NPDC000351 TaxID=3154250 RepID=UPI003328A3E0
MTTHHRPAHVPGTAVTFINIFEIPADHLDAFITEWEQRAALMSTKPGFIDSRLHRAHRSETRFQLVNVSHWTSREAWEAGTADPEFRKRTRAVQEDSRVLVTSSRGLYDVAAEFSAAATTPRKPH